MTIAAVRPRPTAVAPARFAPLRWLLLVLAALLFAVAWPAGLAWGWATWAGAALAEGFSSGRAAGGGS